VSRTEGPLMKIIFLDIDGVLNSKKTPNPRKFPYVVDPKLLRLLVGLIEKTDAKIVLSSTWRLDPIAIMAAKYWGVPVFDLCPDMPDRPRRDEITEWIAAHSDVTRFAVIDDEDDELDHLPLFQPFPQTGLDAEVVDRVSMYLNGSSDQTMRRGRLERAFQNVRSVFNRDKS
jgi:HAD domain in Swiss Army Knife RNA repair proteins